MPWTFADPAAVNPLRRFWPAHFNQVNVQSLITCAMTAWLISGVCMDRSFAAESTVDPKADRAAPRPILFLEADGVNGVQADGRRVKLALPYAGPMPASSPDGKWIAYFADSENHATLQLKSLQNAVNSAVPLTKESIAAELAWSPDGQKIALLASERPEYSYSISVIDMSERKVVSRLEIPRSVIEGRNTSRRVKLAWSPDGQKILLAANAVAVVDPARGSIERLVDKPALADWAPDGNGIYYFNCEGEPCDTPADLYFRPLGTAQPTRLKTKDEVSALGLGRVPFVQGFDPLMLSPDGSRIAIWGTSIQSQRGVPKGATCDIHVYDVRESKAPRLDRPSRSFRTNAFCIALEWSADEYSLAVLSVPTDEPQYLAIRLLDLKSGDWRTLVRLKAGGESYYPMYLYGFRVMRWAR